MCVCAMNDLFFRSWTACCSPYTMQTDRQTDREEKGRMWDDVTFWSEKKSSTRRISQTFGVNRLHIVKYRWNHFFSLFFLFLMQWSWSSFTNLVSHRMKLRCRAKENKQQIEWMYKKKERPRKKLREKKQCDNSKKKIVKRRRKKHSS